MLQDLISSIHWESTPPYQESCWTHRTFLRKFACSTMMYLQISFKGRWSTVIIPRGCDSLRDLGLSGQMAILPYYLLFIIHLLVFIYLKSFSASYMYQSMDLLMFCSTFWIASKTCSSPHCLIHYNCMSQLFILLFDISYQMSRKRNSRTPKSKLNLITERCTSLIWKKIYLFNKVRNIKLSL